jgi:hypothetical protein
MPRDERTRALIPAKGRNSSGFRARGRAADDSSRVKATARIIHERFADASRNGLGSAIVTSELPTLRTVPGDGPWL